jgi:hypothetical protein
MVVVGLLVSCGQQTTTTPSPKAPKIDLLTGTLNLGTGLGNASHFVVYLSSTESLTDADVTVSVKGPTGWNNNQPIVFENARTEALLNFGWLAFPVLGATAVAGDYTLEVSVKGKTYNISDTLSDATFKLSPPTVTVAGNSSSVEVSWDVVAGATSYSVGLFRGNYETQIAGYSATKASNYGFTNLNLTPGTYLVEVAPSNVDFTDVPIKRKPYGVSFANATFVVNE